MFLIKTGASIDGKNIAEKYRALAQYVHDKTEAAVLVQPTLLSLSTEQNMAQLMENAEKLSPETVNIYYIGISKGASVGAISAAKYPKIKGLLLINPPLIINWPKVKRGLEKFTGTKTMILVGEYDPSFRYMKILLCANAKNLELVELYGKGHHIEYDDLRQASESFIDSIFLNE